MESRLDVAVVGAGMGGLAAALALRKLGINATVYEQSQHLGRIGAGIHVKPNALQALMGLGVSDEVVRANAFIPANRRDRDFDTGDITCLMELGEGSIARFGALYTTWHRGDLQTALRSVVPADLIHLGRKVVGVEPSRSAVTITFADASTVKADAVIAADGVGSVVRQKVFQLSDPYYTGRVSYRSVTARREIDEPYIDPLCKWWGPDRHFVHYHVRAGEEVVFTTSIPDSEKSVESWSAKGDIKVLQEALADFHPHVQSIIRAAEPRNVGKWAIYSRQPLDRWSEENVVLLGDACHTMTPYVGQGAAMAFEDAVILARCIAEVGTDREGLREAFVRYERTRRERASEMQRIAESNSRHRGDEYFDWSCGYDAWNAPLSDSGKVSR